MIFWNSFMVDKAWFQDLIVLSDSSVSCRASDIRGVICRQCGFRRTPMHAFRLMPGLRPWTFSPNILEAMAFTLFRQQDMLVCLMPTAARNELILPGALGRLLRDGGCRCLAWPEPPCLGWQGRIRDPVSTPARVRRHRCTAPSAAGCPAFQPPLAGINHGA